MHRHSYHFCHRRRLDPHLEFLDYPSLISLILKLLQVVLQEPLVHPVRAPLPLSCWQRHVVPLKGLLGQALKVPGSYGALPKGKSQYWYRSCSLLLCLKHWFDLSGLPETYPSAPLWSLLTLRWTRNSPHFPQWWENQILSGHCREAWLILSSESM